jgi:hypothetical protein
MPKLYEYFGLIILFYSNEHEPIHVHGKYQGTESKAEFIIDNGQIVEIRYGAVRGRKPLDEHQFNNFKTLEPIRKPQTGFRLSRILWSIF